MFKNQNLRWGLLVIIVLGVTFVMYLNYVSDGETNEIPTTETLTSNISSDEDDDVSSEESVGSSSEEVSISMIDLESSADVDTTNQNERIAVVPNQSSETEETSDSEQASSEVEETSESEQVSSESSVSSSDDPSQDDETQDNYLDIALAFDDIYQVDLMAENGIELLELDDYNNMADVIDQTLAEFNVNSSEISLAYYDFHNEEHYYLNQNELITAASITKVPLAALYIDLIEADIHNLNTELEYREALFERGAGNITNGPLESRYTIEELITEAITNSDNTAMNILKAEYDKEFGNFREDILDFANIDDKPEAYLSSNVSSAYIMEQVLIKIAQDDTYNGLINLMLETSPTQLFTAYVNNDMMANKFGRYERSVNDSGIYYENNQPQYALVILTDDVSNADQFLEVMNLRVNQWFRSQYL